MELENEIHYMNRPLGQALMFLSQGKTNRTSRFARRVYELHKKMEISIEAAWHKSLEEFRSQWPIQRDEWDLLFCIGEVLGKTDRESQSSFLFLMREKFAVREKAAEEDRVKKDKLYKNLGALGGLAVVLVLI
jgi:stage III sporulation protein AB